MESATGCHIHGGKIGLAVGVRYGGNLRLDGLGRVIYFRADTIQFQQDSL